MPKLYFFPIILRYSCAFSFVRCVRFLFGTTCGTPPSSRWGTRKPHSTWLSAFRAKTEDAPGRRCEGCSLPGVYASANPAKGEMRYGRTARPARHDPLRDPRSEARPRLLGWGCDWVTPCRIHRHPGGAGAPLLAGGAPHFPDDTLKRAPRVRGALTSDKWIVSEPSRDFSGIFAGFPDFFPKIAGFVVHLCAVKRKSIVDPLLGLLPAPAASLAAAPLDAAEELAEGPVLTVRLRRG